jgi:hypothetical protein
MRKIVPAIGMGATIMSWSDRSPYTIINITTSGKTITLQADKYRRIDDNGMSELQRYIYQPNPNGNIVKATLRKDNQFRVSKSNAFVSIGRRNRYYDYSF